MKAGGPAQLRLHFPRAELSDQPAIATTPYAAALATLARWRSWPERQLALIGPPGAGKSTLLRGWAIEAGAALASAADLARAHIDDVSALSIAALAIDDADGAGDAPGVLAALNFCRDRGAPVVLAGVGAPVGWFAGPRDLVSRVQAMPAAEIGPPDEATLALRLADECRRRFLLLPQEAAEYIACRMERSYGAPTRMADAIEAAGLTSFSRTALRRVLESQGYADE